MASPFRSTDTSLSRTTHSKGVRKKVHDIFSHFLVKSFPHPLLVTHHPYISCFSRFHTHCLSIFLCRTFILFMLLSHHNDHHMIIMWKRGKEQDLIPRDNKSGSWRWSRKFLLPFSTLTFFYHFSPFLAVFYTHVSLETEFESKERREERTLDSFILPLFLCLRDDKSSLPVMKFMSRMYSSRTSSLSYTETTQDIISPTLKSTQFFWPWHWFPSRKKKKSPEHMG